MDCFVAEPVIGPAEGGTRWLLANDGSLAMTNNYSITLDRIAASGTKQVSYFPKIR